MSGKLVHVPFDRGIDESAETAGALQTTALARCVNLWHARNGVLSPRPGTREHEIAVDDAGSVNLIGNAAGSNLVMVDGHAEAMKPEELDGSKYGGVNNAWWNGRSDPHVR